MKKITEHLYISLALVAILGVKAYSLESAVRSPVSSPTTPQSAYTDRPIINTADIYGQYGGYDQTQGSGGFVPYNSLNNLDGQRSLDRLRSLLRQSANPYYSPSQTTRPLGQLGLDQTQLTLKGGPDSYRLGDLPNEISLLDLSRQRPMASEISDIEKSLTRDIKLLELAQKYGDLTPEQSVLQEPVRKANPDITELLGRQKPLEPETPQQPGKLFTQEPKLADVKDGDVYDSFFDQMEKDELQKQLEEKVPESKYMNTRKLKPLPQADHEKAAEIRGEHKTFEQLAEANLLGYIEAAKKLLADGKFYKAADACTLASVWMPENAEAHLIKGLSLFGAGEYMSASFFIQQAIELKKEYASEKIELKEKITDIDLIDNRLVEAKQWQRQTGSPELAFLMAYIHYQQGNVISAAEMIEKAVEKDGDNMAIRALQEVVEAADRY